MAKFEVHLQRWLTAGLLEADSAARIRAFEAEHRGAPGEDTGIERPGLMEVLVYLGVAVIAVGVFILVEVNWEELDDWARVLATLVPGLFALGAGWAMQRTGVPGFVRGGQVAWLAATGLIAGTVAVAGSNSDWQTEDILLVTGIAATIVALALWALAPGHPQVIGIGGSLVELSMALGARSDDFNFAVAGIALAAFAAAGVALAERRLLTPTLSARTLSGAGLAFGAFFAGSDAAAFESLAFIAAGVLLALGIWRGTFLYVVAGAAVFFVGLVRTISMHIEEPSAVAAALILVGALLIVVVIGFSRWQPWKQARP